MKFAIALAGVNSCLLWLNLQKESGAALLAKHTVRAQHGMRK